MNAKIGFCLIVLSQLRLNCPVALASQSYEADSTLASRERTSNGFVIRQDKFQSGAVLVSRPNLADTMILDILYNNGIRSVEDYAAWLEANITYKPDGGQDIWALPQETLERRSGDCEDFSFLNAAVLAVLGYKPKVLGLNGIRSLAGKSGNHAICVFDKGGRMMYFDNQKLKISASASIAEFARYAFLRYGCSSIDELEFDNNNKQAKALAFPYAQPF